VDVNGTDMEYSCNNTVKDMRLGLLRQSSTKQIKINQTIPKGLIFLTCAGHVGDTVVYYIVDHEGGIVVRGGSACLCFTPGP